MLSWRMHPQHQLTKKLSFPAGLMGDRVIGI
jgi:hypothetical protein